MPSLFTTVSPSEPFLSYIQSLRAFAIFLVIATHTKHVFSWDDASASSKLITLIYSNGTVLFVFIAGYLFQHLLNKYDTKIYYLKKLQYVITPYILISIPAIIFFIAIEHRQYVLWHIYQKPVWLQIVYFYDTGAHIAPVWFIPTIIIFYIIAPFFIKADKTNWFYYCLPAFFLITHFIGRGMVINNFVHFFSAYIFGMFCSRYKITINQWVSKTSVLCALIATYFGLIFKGYYAAEVYLASLLYFQKIFLCLVSLRVFIKLSRKAETKLTQTIADTSFGVFFIHSYVLAMAKVFSNQLRQHFNSNQTLINGNLLLHLVTTFIVLMVSVVIVIAVKNLLNNKSRYLVDS